MCSFLEIAPSPLTKVAPVPRGARGEADSGIDKNVKGFSFLSDEEEDATAAITGDKPDAKEEVVPSDAGNEVAVTSPAGR